MITRTPTRSATTSTPSSSPIPPPIPPKKCQNLVPPTPKIRSCSLSGSCSDVSSIQGEVFTDGEVDNLVPPFEPQLLPTDSAVSKPFRTTTEMEEAEIDILEKRDELHDLMADFDVVDVDRLTIHDYKEKLSRIECVQLETKKKIRSFVRTYSSIDALKCDDWNKQIDKIQADVRNNRDKIKAKVLEIQDATNDGVGGESLDAKKIGVAVQEAISNSNTNQTMREADAKRNDALVEVKSKADSILFDAEELDKVINEVCDWRNASDNEVKKAVRNIKEWKKEMIKIIEAKRQFLIVVDKYQFTEVEDGVSTVKVKGDVDDLKADMDTAILAIESEDNIRALYTLDITPVTDPVKLPKLSGKEGEDYHKFKEELEHSFVKNRIPKADQLSKHRECSSGAALAL